MEKQMYRRLTAARWASGRRGGVNRCLIAVCAAAFLTSFLLLCHSLTHYLSQTAVVSTTDEWPPSSRQPAVDYDARQHPWLEDCTLVSCFDSHRCSVRLSVYLYPLANYSLFSPSIPPYSREFLQIRQSIMSSEYYESDPNKACVFIPNIDLLNMDRVVNGVHSLAVALSSLKWWNAGRNHLLISFLADGEQAKLRQLPIGQAILLQAGFRSKAYRNNFDVAIPVYYQSQDPKSGEEESVVTESQQRQLLVSFELHDAAYDRAISPVPVDTLRVTIDLDTHGEWKTMVGDYVKRYKQQTLMKNSRFCLLRLSDSVIMQHLLLELLRFKCLPIIMSNDDVLLPFEEILDWKRFSKRIYTHQVSSISKLIAGISEDDFDEMTHTGRQMWRQYFSSLQRVVHTSLKVIDDRLFPITAKSFSEWNEIGGRPSQPEAALFLERTAPLEGFTAVILAYDRVAALFRTIRMVAAVRSCVKIVVVWNNPLQSPPEGDQFPNVGGIQIHVARMSRNRLTNRYFPLDSIETEAVFSLDDDISMLTVDEIEFAYQTWREFPASLVGFPSRVHIYNATTSRYQYNSEWTNDISMILTGASFYHKHYGYLFHKDTPKSIMNHVDSVMNCEDIAFNFAVANVSRSPVIKVTPRKRFVCPNCGAPMGLSADSQHIRERSECLDYFAKIYGGVPLKTVAFRADPVQYGMSGVTDGRFGNIGAM